MALQSQTSCQKNTAADIATPHTHVKSKTATLLMPKLPLELATTALGHDGELYTAASVACIILSSICSSQFASLANAVLCIKHPLIASDACILSFTIDPDAAVILFSQKRRTRSAVLLHAVLCCISFSKLLCTEQDLLCLETWHSQA